MLLYLYNHADIIVIPQYIFHNYTIRFVSFIIVIFTKVWCDKADTCPGIYKGGGGQEKIVPFLFFNI